MNTLSEIQGLSHAFHIQGFNANNVVLIGYLSALLLQEISSGISNFCVNFSYFNLMVLITITGFLSLRTLLFSRKFSLFPSKFLLVNSKISG